MNDKERQAILGRLEAFVEQQRGADDLADHGSLERAADVMALYEDRHWVSELPPPKTTRHRGRPVDPESFSRFTKWLGEKVPLGGARLYQLRDAHELSTKYFDQVEIKPSGEREVRPLKWLTRHDYSDRVSEVWELACELAGNRSPDGPTVRRAVAKWKHDNLPKTERKSGGRSGEALAEKLKRDAHRLMEEYPELFVKTIDAIEADAEAFVNKALAA